MKSIPLTFICSSSSSQCFDISVEEFTLSFGSLRFEFHDRSFVLDCDYLNVTTVHSFCFVLEPEVYSSFYHEVCMIL